jgi:hypothetical protein
VPGKQRLPRTYQETAEGRLEPTGAMVASGTQDPGIKEHFPPANFSADSYTCEGLGFRVFDLGFDAAYQRTPIQVRVCVIS